DWGGRSTLESRLTMVGRDVRLPVAGAGGIAAQRLRGHQTTAALPYAPRYGKRAGMPLAEISPRASRAKSARIRRPIACRSATSHWPVWRAAARSPARGTFRTALRVAS